jgi:CMP-N-acetylneuraminic acid synthetase
MIPRKMLALIPARGGSKRFPRKNVAMLDNKPLLAWTIQPLLSTGLFDRVYVSSEDEKILQIAKDWGAACIRRPDKLAGDQVALEPVCRHAVESLATSQETYTDLLVALPTSPFRKKDRLIRAWQYYMQKDVDTLMSIVAYPHPPQWAMAYNDKGFLAPHNRKGFYQERQELLPLYRHEGAYFITRIDRFFETGTLMGPKTISFDASPMESVDIDTPMDLEWASFLLSTQRKRINEYPALESGPLHKEEFKP